MKEMVYKIFLDEQLPIFVMGKRLYHVMYSTGKKPGPKP